jgi:hypothetical protein
VTDIATATEDITDVNAEDTLVNITSSFLRDVISESSSLYLTLLESMSTLVVITRLNVDEIVMSVSMSFLKVRDSSFARGVYGTRPMWRELISSS